MKTQWESVNGDRGYQFTERLKVEGGHLYCRRDYIEELELLCTSMCFVPDERVK